MLVVKNKNCSPKTQGNFNNFQDVMNNFLSNDFSHFWGNDYQLEHYNANILEDEHSYKIELVLPGIPKENLSIQLEENLLTVTSNYDKSKATDQTKYLKRGFNIKNINRKFQIPENVDKDKIEARHELGILSLVLPKIEKKKEEHKSITIR